MRFYIEFKNIELCEWYLEEENHIPWNDDLRALIRVHQMYRAWINTSPQNESAVIPQNILDDFNKLLEIYAGLYEYEDAGYIEDDEVEKAKERSNLGDDEDATWLHLYPGLVHENYSFHETSIENLKLDTSFDIDALLANEHGIPMTQEVLNALIPKSTYLNGHEICGYLDFPIQMSPEQIKEEESDGTWYMIGWNTILKIAGICVDSHGVGMDKKLHVVQPQ